jgi:adenylosuccinate synthase
MGVRAGDLLNLSILKEKIEQNVEEKNIYLRHYSHPLLDPEEVYTEYAGYASKLAGYIADVSELINAQMKEGKSVLFEGAQGALLDVDHGTYPFVTSSNSTAGGICTGLGVGPDKIGEILGIAKAYTTRVGSGSFPTEDFGETGQFLKEKGNEFGATTGRPRRCGWFDGIATGYSCKVNGIKKICLTKPDVLDGLEELKICVGYNYKGETLTVFPTESWVLEQVEPQYISVKGWRTPIQGSTQFSSLPQEFLDYTKRIEDLIEAKVCIISTGMERKETVFVEEELEGLLDLDKIRSAVE